MPAGTYQIVAWHEGWGREGIEQVYDVLTQRRVDRPLFTAPLNWEKSVTVTGNSTSVVNFVISGTDGLPGQARKVASP